MSFLTQRIWKWLNWMNTGFGPVAFSSKVILEKPGMFLVYDFLLPKLVKITLEPSSLPQYTPYDVDSRAINACSCEKPLRAQPTFPCTNTSVIAWLPKRNLALHSAQRCNWNIWFLCLPLYRVNPVISFHGFQKICMHNKRTKHYRFEATPGLTHFAGLSLNLVFKNINSDK